MKFVFRLAQWLVYLPIHLLVILARYPLSPFAVIFFTTNDKRQLLAPFTWLGTIDNDLAGDSGWQTEHIKPGSDPLSLWNRIRWLWRNGGNTLNYQVLGCSYDADFNDRYTGIQDSDRLWIRSDGYWMLRCYLKFGARYLNLFIGWSVFGPVQGRCKFTCTIRIKQKRPVYPWPAS